VQSLLIRIARAAGGFWGSPRPEWLTRLAQSGLALPGLGLVVLLGIPENWRTSAAR
jgi:hypothetical protein